jgi:hypothetical protein
VRLAAEVLDGRELALGAGGDSSAAPRLLFWGHSHAGNVFALLSHLLSGDAAAVDAYFQAAAPYLRRWLGRRPAHWGQVREALHDWPAERAGQIDFVTFGTPIRYGWETAGYGKLLHFVNHRPAPELPPYRAPFPPRDAEVRQAVGDAVHQFGIAGTNFLPNLPSWRAVLADRRLGRLLQPDLRRRDLPARLRCGMRVPDEGTTLLVDYGGEAGHFAQHLAGHAVYTRERWLLFHAEQIARRLYGIER